MSQPRRVFLSYRSVDKARVLALATQLNAAGIDAWFDGWEILPGDDFVTKINQGLDSCDVGLIFFSNASLDGKWHQAEINALTVLTVENNRPLIPVLLDLDAKIPALLRSRSRVAADQVQDLIDAIQQRTHKPAPRTQPQPDPTRFLIRLRDLGGQNLGVSTQLDQQPPNPESTVQPGADFQFSYADFINSRVPGGRITDTRQLAQHRDRELHKLGDAIGRVVFPASAASDLANLLDTAPPSSREVELIFETPDPRLLSIPFEAARLPDGRVPALLPGVFVWRRLGSQPASQKAGAPGPLKILVAVGAPDEGTTRSAVLDSEQELQTILDSVEKARLLGNAYVRVLEVGSLDQIGKALREHCYHVLHLSGHGTKGILELEDEDGRPQRATAAELAAKIRDSGHPAPLVFLASCLGGVGDSETASFAQGLLSNGVPAVLAMQTSVSDQYATELAGDFYDKLASAERPLPARLLSIARRDVEAKRRKRLAQGQFDSGVLAEYATPSLFLAGEEHELIDRSLDLQPVRESLPAPSVGAVPLLKIGELIGRRRETREILGVLTHDREAGCQILGTGGVGKSSVAGRILQRLADRGWRIVTVSARWNLGGLAKQVGATLWNDSDPNLKKFAATLVDDQTPEPVRLSRLQELLQHHQLLLVFDNFEDNLTILGERFLDPVLSNLFQTLLGATQCGKILVTSRYPLPNAEGLRRVDLGPLSPAETRKLMLRHQGLRAQSSEDVRIIDRAIGGHPRTLEYLDALLQHGHARLSRVEARLKAYARQAGVSLEGGTSLADALPDAIRVAAADAMVEELVDAITVRPGDLEVLWQASVYPMPVPTEAVAADIEIVDRLTASSLLTRMGEGQVFVHRWTAESLKLRMGESVYRSCCVRAGAYLDARRQNGKRSVEDVIAGMRLYLAGADWDRGVQLAWSAVRFLRNYGQTSVWTELAREVGDALPSSQADKLRFIGTEGEGLGSLGLTGLALERHQAVASGSERLLTQEPDRADYLRDLAVSYNKMGDLLKALGQGENARQFFQKSLDLRERLAAQEPDRADYLRDLSVSYERMGDLLRVLGQGESARQFFQKSLDIRERLADQEPDRADYLRDLSISHERMGDLLHALGQGESARQFFQEMLGIRERLAAQEPDRADLERELCVPYERMGDLGQGESARQFFQKALDIRERLAAQEPDRADLQRDLCVPYERMGDLLSALGQGESARQYFQKSLDIIERLAAQEPDRADFAIDLAKSLARTGDEPSLERALQILTDLDQTGRLQLNEQPVLAAVKRDLARVRAAGLRVH